MLNERKGWNRRRTILLIVFALVVLAVIGVFLLVTRLIADRARTAALHELGQTFASTGAAPCEPGSMGQSGSVAEVECIFDHRYVFFNKWQSLEAMRANYPPDVASVRLLPWNRGLYAGWSKETGPKYYFDLRDQLISIYVIDYKNGDALADLSNWLQSGALGGPTPGEQP